MNWNGDFQHKALPSPGSSQSIGSGVMMKQILQTYFRSFWLPGFVCICVLVAWLGSEFFRWGLAADILFPLLGLVFLGLLAASAWNLLKRRWALGLANVIFTLFCAGATFGGFLYLLFAFHFGPSEDGFADNLTIPEGIDISEPLPDTSKTPWTNQPKPSDALQLSILKALETPGNDSIEFTPSMPSLRKASRNHLRLFLDYLDASPDWHVFVEDSKRFATRRWSYGGEPRSTLHGYNSRNETDGMFQSRCLLSFDDRRQDRLKVLRTEEGSHSVRPEVGWSNNQHSSRVLIECGGIWIEIYEQSDNLERRITKTTITTLETEFSDFVRNPKAALDEARARSRAWADRHAGEEGHPFSLQVGMQPGIYNVVYSLNPGEPGFVYLKAFEVTKDTPLSTARLKEKTTTRLAWSDTPTDRFGAKSRFTIYEGDWGKSYAARFEVWFIPDSGAPERKIAERIFKIEGWQR